jgi:serine phosphatase RsbU (regulator of sigma subunit)
MIARKLLILFFLVNTCSAFSQDINVDSLKRVISKNIKDTATIKALLTLSHYHLNLKQFDTAIVNANKALDLSQQLKQVVLSAKSDWALGRIFMKKAEFDKAIGYYDNAIDLLKQIPLCPDLPMNYGSRGNVYYQKGLYPQANQNFIEAAKGFGALGDKADEAGYLGNIGAVYQSIGEDEKAINYYNKALKVNVELKREDAMALNYVCIGNVYNEQQKYGLAIVYFKSGLLINERLSDSTFLANNLAHLSAAYQNSGEFQKAYHYAKRALSIAENTMDVELMITSRGILAESCTRLKKFQDAENYLLKNERAIQTINSLDFKNTNAKQLAALYYDWKKFERAAYYYKMHASLKDSILNNESNRKVLQQQAQFEYQKKAASDSIRVAEQRKVTDAQLKQEKTQRWALYGGLALVIIFAGFMFNRFKITKAQKNIIELKEIETHKQKHIIEEKHKEITDSINYAERIQRSFLATKELLDSNLNEHFVLFQPKDVVSGDFYWATFVKTAVAEGNRCLFYLVTADSTGHGVPGAIMSLLNISSLEKAMDKGLTKPSDILNSTRKTIIERLKKDGSVEGGKDGMDCSLVCFDFQGGLITYTAANNPIWVVRKGSLIELAPDKMPVGKHDRDQQSFTQHEFLVKKDDLIYTLTDGFPDQFGGPKGKKFMYRQLKELLVSVSQLPLEEQKEKLMRAITEWKGSHEQVDDILLIGIRI